MIIRSIDVGNRNCKLTERVTGGEVQCRAFPSIAPIASDRDLGISRRSQRDTMIVTVGKLRYEIGPDAGLARASAHCRPLTDDWYVSDEHLAICLGALRMMRVESVDLLMVGLPVSLFKRMKAKYEQRLIGLHSVDEGRSVEVRRVVAMAQPVGAFLSYAVPHGARREMLKTRNLLIDPGWRTFDWIVTQGLKLLDRRSNAVDRGMFDVVEAIAGSLADQLGTRLGAYDFERIDEALRKRAPPKFFGKAISLDDYLIAGEKVAREAVGAMKQLVQDGSDIDHILLAGGGAFFFRREIQRAYPKHQIQETAQPLYANVLGFQIAGQELVGAERRRFDRQASTENTE
jgi:plasmid segregation protein ParM